MPLVKEHGAAVVALTIDEEGQARTAEWKVRIADRLVDDLVEQLGHARRGHPRRLPHLPDRHRAGGDPPRRHRDHRGDPRAQADPPRRADHARRLQRLLRAQPRRARGAQLGVPARVRRGRARLRDRARVEDRADGPHPRRAARGRARPGLRPPPLRRRGHPRARPALALPRAVRGRRRRRPREGARRRAARRCRCPSGSQRRIVDGERKGLEADLDEALHDRGRRSRSSTTRCSRA